MRIAFVLILLIAGCAAFGPALIEIYRMISPRVVRKDSRNV
jgi:hypothetical protein